MKLAIVTLPVIFAIIWMLFIGLNINKLNKKINYLFFIINCLRKRLLLMFALFNYEKLTTSTKRALAESS